MNQDRPEAAHKMGFDQNSALQGDSNARGLRGVYTLVKDTGR